MKNGGKMSKLLKHSAQVLQVRNTLNNPFSEYRISVGKNMLNARVVGVVHCQQLGDCHLFPVPHKLKIFG
jgi:hypothetical protein